MSVEWSDEAQGNRRIAGMVKTVCILYIWCLTNFLTGWPVYFLFSMENVSQLLSKQFASYHTYRLPWKPIWCFRPLSKNKPYIFSLFLSVQIMYNILMFYYFNSCNIHGSHNYCPGITSLNPGPLKSSFEWNNNGSVIVRDDFHSCSIRVSVQYSVY